MSEILEHRAADTEITDRILNFLRFRKKGATISEIAREADLNRNSVAKYLEVLLASGQVELRRIGKAKAFSLSRRVPISALIDTLAEYALILDDHTRIIEINELYLSLCGRRKKDVIGCLLAEADLPGLTDELIPLALGALGGDPLAREIDLMQNGSTRHFQVNFVPTVLASGENGLMILLADTTEKTKADSNLRDSEKFFRTILNNINAAIFLHDVDESGRPGRFFTVNDVACEMFGCSRDELVGTTFASFALPDSTRAGDDFSHLEFREGESAATKTTLVNRRGEQMAVRIRSHSYRYNGAPVVLSIAWDATREREAEEKERRYIQSLEYLYGTATELSRFHSDQDIHAYIADEIYRAVPNALVAVNAPPEDGSGWVNRAFRGREQHRQCFEAVLRESPLTMTGKEMRLFKSGVLFHHRVSDDEIALAEGAKQASLMIAERLGYGEYYIKGLVADGVLYGMVIVCLPLEEMLVDPEMVEAFLDQASVALQKQQAVRRLEEGNEELRRELAKHESDLCVLQKALGDQRYGREQAKKTVGDLTHLAFRCLSLAGVAAVGLSRNGQVAHINRAMCSHLGCGAGDAVGRHWYSSFVPASVQEKAMELHRLVLAGVIGSGEMVCPLLAGDGTERKMVWVAKRVGGGQDDGLAILWLGEELPGERVMALSLPV